MAENCENFKRPRQLGLSIHTSDVSLYDGDPLLCVDLPDNADLNDVIEAFGEKFCSLITLINNIDTSSGVPVDDWVYVDNATFTAKTFSGTGGTTLVGALDDATCEVAYQVISPNSILLHGHLNFEVNIDNADPGFENGNFVIILRFPAISSPGGHFLGTKVCASAFPIPYPDVHPVAVTSQRSPSYAAIDNGAGTMSATNLAGVNVLILTVFPNITYTENNIEIGIRFATNVKIITTP